MKRKGLLERINSQLTLLRSLFLLRNPSFSILNSQFSIQTRRADKRYRSVVRSIFGFRPHNIELYKLALVHRSASVALPGGGVVNNERLEFLGDAILEAIVSDWLFIEFPRKDEGFLTRMRSRVVSRTSLNRLCIDIGLSEHLLSHTPAKDLFGDALEAMIGAIYLDRGYDFCNRLIINRLFARHISLSELAGTEVDFKSRLIERCQKNHRSIRFQTSPTHGGFVARAIIDGAEAGSGEGSSKKEAEQEAAKIIMNYRVCFPES